MELITGGTGFLGAHLAANILLTGNDVRILRRPFSNFNELDIVFRYYFSDNASGMLKKINFTEGDITDVFSIKTALENVDNVFHCAGFVSFVKSDKQRMIEINEKGTENLVNVLLNNNIKKLCHVSSIAALGRNDDNKLITEDNEWIEHNKNTSYAISKYKAEKVVWRAINEGLNAVIVNPGVILGVGGFDNVSGKLFNMVKNGLKFYTEGVNGYVDATDVSQIMIKLTESDISAEKFILTSENVSYEWFFNEIAKNLSVKPPTIYANSFLRNFIVVADYLKTLLTGRKRFYTFELARLANSCSYYSSNKVEKAIKYKFIPVAETIGKICGFFKNNAVLL